MSEMQRPDGDDTLLALLYAAGELEAPAAAAFERRLADDQSARDALCSAVRMHQAMCGQPEPVPDRAYRKRVRARLRGPGWWKRIAAARSYAGHSSLWALAGAVAAATAVVIWLPPLTSTPEKVRHIVLPPLSAQAPTPAFPVDADEADDGPELMGGRHLARTLHEEQSRRVRGDRRLARLEDRATPLHSAPVYSP